MKTFTPLRALALIPVLWLCSTHPVSLASRSLPFEPVVDTQIFDLMYNRKIRPLDVLFTSDVQYQLFFGHAAPGVDWSRDWVALYSAGQVPTGGFWASTRSIEPSPATGDLSITTSLKIPGPGCIVTMALETPYMLVKFPIPSPAPTSTTFHHLYVVEDCP